VEKAGFICFFYFYDFLRLFSKLDRKICAVQVSPSLIPVPLMRDVFIILMAKIFRRKVIVYYRCWKENIVSVLKKETISQKAFKYVYRKADVSKVLASHFKDDLINMGWNPDTIQISTTMYVHDDILPAKDKAGMSPRFLFLGMINSLPKKLNGCR
jgi:hypothetical protein